MAGRSKLRTNGCAWATPGKYVAQMEPLMSILGVTQKLTTTIKAAIGCAGFLRK